jgi:glutamate dehydrogenase/leucine dehydrogenase
MWSREGLFQFSDEIGPEKVLYVHDPKTEMKGTLVAPDFIANAGGLITGAVEYRGGTEKEVFRVIKDKMVRNTKLVLDMAKDQKMLPRDVAKR